MAILICTIIFIASVVIVRMILNYNDLNLALHTKFLQLYMSMEYYHLTEKELQSHIIVCPFCGADIYTTALSKKEKQELFDLLSCPICHTKFVYDTYKDQLAARNKITNGKEK